jgi:SAM-dependent methyltransferase
LRGCINLLPPPYNELILKNPDLLLEGGAGTTGDWFGASDATDQLNTEGRHFLDGCEGTVLDVGCGSRPASDCAIDVVAPPSHVPNYVVAHAARLPFLAKTYDVVYSAFVIEHLLQPAEFIISCCRIARSKVVILTDNGEWLGFKAFRMLNRGCLFHRQHTHLWTQTYLANLALRLGLDSHVDCVNSSTSWYTTWAAKIGRVPRIGPWWFNALRLEIDVSQSSPVDMSAMVVL